MCSSAKIFELDQNKLVIPCRPKKTRCQHFATIFMIDDVLTLEDALVVEQAYFAFIKQEYAVSTDNRINPFIDKEV
ncbi:hypothetical protein A4U49_09975 [Acidithiobacillus ferrivorans]|nr:hypothetical protein A4U49_09975 [Acidithiobacillus ferrivorans]